MRTRLESPDLYTIGWIAALPIELAAATALLHDRHDEPEGFDQHRSDENSYKWGRIGQHNVVIASLPAGVYGIAAAATTALNLIRSLPHIRIGLLVGIGGGIARPDEGQDIRLGDIVVSQPDGMTGGVVQYDLGKAKANGVWEWKGSLDKPPLVLLHALSSLQAEHMITGSRVPELLHAMWEANPRMRISTNSFTYQGAENDRLFQSQYDHIGGNNCDKCDSSWEVKRDRRESTDPEIHYGVIASGNTLIKDAPTRDRLLEDTGHQCLCVEMEAAGLMDRFPCLVIRGICDYADSHKNDQWQRYAAATAAAFAVELLDYVPVGQLEASQKVIEVIQSFDGKICNLVTSLDKIGHHINLDHLPNAEGASFDSHAEEHNPTCLANTRVELLRDIDHWIDDATSKTIFWLNGMAGTGKSTISRTVARSRSERGDLGASFFFKRGETDRGNLTKFVTTVARRLAWSTPGAATLIKNAVEADSAIADKTVREQFEKLVREPLSKAMTTSLSRPSVVIVVDALDECESDADIKLLLELFSTLRFACFHVRVLVTSRPELPVRLGFSSIKGTHQDLILHEIPQSIIKHDIAVFLRHEFNSIRENFNNLKEDWRLPVDWPTEADLIKLTMAAVPLFIYAATICRFVNDSCLGNPDKLLQSVLHHTSKDHASKLDMTYSPVLKQQVINRSGRERRNIIESFRLIVGAIVTLASPLSVRALALLLNVHIDEVTTRLRMLHSVLEVPASLYTPVRLLHLSFRDYLVDSENKETVEFWVDEKLAHRRLAQHCLRVMRGALRENICSLSCPGMHRSAVGVRQLEERIPPELQYACMNWVHHQTKVDLEPNGSNAMYDFLKTHFLHWLEVLSFMGRIPVSIGFIDELQSIVDPEKSVQALSFLRDAKRFVLNYRWIIDTAPLQLYASAIVFAPKQSTMRQTFKHYIPTWISPLPNVDSDWNAVLQTLEGHMDPVTSVVFSNNGTLIASGSHDKTIRIWKVVTGEEEQTLKGHMHFVTSVVFSNDSTLIASGSHDKTVKIWKVATGKEEQTLKGHTDSVYSVVFSNDSSLIASESHDKTVKIWKVATGEEERTLKGHTYSVTSVAFSNDGKLIASGSWDKTIKIWNVATGEEERTLKGHTDSVYSVVFSNDSSLIASESDKTIKIWNVSTGKEERTLKGHTDSVYSMVLSNDSKFIASGSDDETVKIWNVETDEEERTLKGHTDSVTSVAFSNDSKLIASGSGDKTVKIWNVSTGEEERTLKGHTDSVTSVAFSNDGKLIASGSGDKTVKIWNVSTGKEERTLKGHTDSVYSMVFSNDSTLIASGSRDKTVKIWNLATGINVKSFDTSPATKVLYFTDDDSVLVTSAGRFSLGFRDINTLHSSENEPNLGSTEVQGEMDARLGFGTNHDNTWITAGGPDGRKVLWLPPDFRPGASMTLTQPSGSVIVIGSPSGRVVIMGFEQSSFSDKV